MVTLTLRNTYQQNFSHFVTDAIFGCESRKTAIRHNKTTHGTFRIHSKF